MPGTRLAISHLFSFSRGSQRWPRDSPSFPLAESARERLEYRASTVLEDCTVTLRNMGTYTVLMSFRRQMQGEDFTWGHIGPFEYSVLHFAVLSPFDSSLRRGTKSTLLRG